MEKEKVNFQKLTVKMHLSQDIPRDISTVKHASENNFVNLILLT